MAKNMLYTFALIICLTAGPLKAQEPAFQPFTTEDKSFSFNYPAGWIVEVINAEQGPNAHLSLDNLPLEKRFESVDEVNLQITLPTKYFTLGALSGTTPTTPREAVIQSMSGFNNQPVPIDIVTPSADGTPQPLQISPTTPEIREFRVDGRQSAYAYISIQMGGIDVSQMVIVVDVGNDHWVSVSATSYKGGLETLRQNESTILTIMQSMRFTPPEIAFSGDPNLPHVYSGFVGIWQRGSLTLFYPEDWNVYYQMTLVMSNKPGNLLNTRPEAGQFIAQINGTAETTAIVDPSVMSDLCGTSKTDLTARKLIEQLMGRLTPAQLEQMKEAGITLTQPEVVTINQKEIVFSRIYQGDYEQLSMLIDLGEGNILSMTITTKLGEMAQFEPQLFAVAGTFEYAPKPCIQPTATS